jgi:hypothetical protein
VPHDANPAFWDEINRLWDAKFLHLVAERFQLDHSVYSVYALDVGALATVPSNMRGVVVDLSSPGTRDLLRKKRLIVAA